jgi:hypothetical protein
MLNQKLQIQRKKRMREPQEMLALLLPVLERLRTPKLNQLLLPPNDYD